MEYTNKVVRISAYTLITFVFITLCYQGYQNWGAYNYWKSMLTILYFLFPIPFNIFYFRKRSGKSVGANLLLLALNIFTCVGLIFKYYLFPLTH